MSEIVWMMSSDNLPAMPVDISFEDSIRGLILGWAAESPDVFYPAYKAI
jgi:hypothetical protein